MKTEPNDNTFPGNNRNDYYRPGLTKREYFAAIAMQSLIVATNVLSFEQQAFLAVSAADALICELNKEVDDE